MATSNILSSNPIDWTTFYERNRNDGGGIQRLFETNLATLSLITTSHLKRPDKLVETIAGSTYSNMLMVAGDEDGMVNILHHGFVNATSFGGEASILFLSGNSSEAPLKALAHASAVVPLKSGSGRTRRGGTRATLDSPTFSDMWKVESETAFMNLRGNGNPILRDKPNHMMIGPAIFTLAGGAQRIRAKTLAFQIISRIRDETGDDSASSALGGSILDDAEADAENTHMTPPPTTSRSRTTDVIEIFDSGHREGSLGEDDTDAQHWDDDEDRALLQRPRGGADDPSANENDPGTVTAGGASGDGSSNESPTDDSNDHIEHLLSWLWACEKKMVVSSKLSDPIYDDLLVSRLRTIRTKLDEAPNNEQERGNRRHVHRPGSPSTGVGNVSERRKTNTFNTRPTDRQSDVNAIATAGLSSLATTTKEIADVLERMEMNRRQEHTKKESDKSFLRNLGTMQRELFSTLCTDELGEIAEHPKFLKGLMETKTPQKAIAMIRSEIWEWEGSFFDGPFHRFLANGYLSRDGNKGSPGGFTLFMFCPKNVEASLNTNKSDIALLRDYFGLDVDDDTVNHYAKQGWFYPSNHYDLRVQLKTALSMLELLTGEGSIATHGLSYILHSARWDRYAPLLAERFKTESLFGAKFVYCLDRNLQVFFAKVSRWDADDPLSTEANYLRNKAEGLLDRIDDGHTLGTILPSTIYGPAGAKRALEQQEASGGDAPNKKGRSTGPNKQSTAGRSNQTAPLTTLALLESAETTNTNTVPEWLLPKGTQYYDFFLSKDRSTRGWPLLDDARLTSSPAPMCIRFQATGKCREACRMAHVLANAMTADSRKRIGDRFRDAYGARSSA